MAKNYDTKAYRTKKMKLARKLHKMSRELTKLCRHCKKM
jgi:hypothetical protein